MSAAGRVTGPGSTRRPGIHRWARRGVPRCRHGGGERPSCTRRDAEPPPHRLTRLRPGQDRRCRSWRGVRRQTCRRGSRGPCSSSSPAWPALSAASWLLGKLSDLLLILVVSLFLSFALEPAVDWLAQRGWRRGSATGLVLAVLFVGTVLFLGAIGKLVVDQVSEFIDQAPAKAESIEDWINRTFGTHLSSDRSPRSSTSPTGPSAPSPPAWPATPLGFSLSALGVVFQFFTILLFTFYLVADGPRFRRTICSFLRPDRQREVLANWEIAIQKTGGYIYSRLLLGAALGLLPLPRLRAHRRALRHRPGPVRRAGVAVRAGHRHLHRRGAARRSIALAVDPVDALWVLGFAVVYQQIENYLFAPRITRPDDVAAPGGRVRLGHRRRRPVRSGRRPAGPAGGGGAPGDRVDLRRPPRGGRDPHDRTEPGARGVAGSPDLRARAADRHPTVTPTGNLGSDARR